MTATQAAAPKKTPAPVIAASLKAMAENKEDGVQKATYFKVHPDKVEFEEGFNLRDEGPDLDAHLEAMYVSMKAGAAFPPIDVSVVDGRLIARDGHCRTRTAKRLIAEGIPYQLEARQFRGNEVACVMHMLGSAQGKPLTPLESGRGYMRLIKYGMKVAEIANQTGLTRTSIDNGLMLAEAPIKVQKLISDGYVSAGVALDMLRKHGTKAGEHMEALVFKAKEAGAKKVTKKHVAGPRVSPAIVQSFVTAASDLRKYIDETPAEAKAMEVGGTVMVPARLLNELLTAHAAIK